MTAINFRRNPLVMIVQMVLNVLLGFILGLSLLVHLEETASGAHLPNRSLRGNRTLLSLSLSVRLSVYLSVYIYIYICVCICICLSVSAFLSVSLYANLALIALSLCVFFSVSLSLSPLSMSIFLYIYICLCLSLCISVSHLVTRLLSPGVVAAAPVSLAFMGSKRMRLILLSLSLSPVCLPLSPLGAIFWNLPAKGPVEISGRNMLGCLFFLVTHLVFTPLDCLSLFAEDRELFNRSANRSILIHDEGLASFYREGDDPTGGYGWGCCSAGTQQMGIIRHWHIFWPNRLRQCLSSTRLSQWFSSSPIGWLVRLLSVSPLLAVPAYNRTLAS